MQPPCLSRLELNLLGEVCLLRDGTRLRLPSSKSFCMLAYVLISQTRKIAIADLSDLLWPVSTGSQARHSISQLVYSIHKRTAPTLLLRRSGDLLEAAGGGVTCDVLEFESQVRSGEWLKAIRVYGGAFLQGLEIKADERFEQWKDSVDARLVLAYTYCVDKLLSNAEKDDPAAIETWTRQAMLVLPTHVNLVRLHYRSLADQGKLDEAERGLGEYLQMRSAELTDEERELLKADRVSVTSARSSAGEPKVIVTRPTFVGRTEELVHLREVLAEARIAGARAVILAGDPGIGKTRILEQFGRFAAIRGVRVLCAFPSLATAQVPFAGVRDLITQALAYEGPPSEVIYPYLQQLLAGNAGRAAADASVPAVYQESEHLLCTLMDQGPLLLTIDDLHWLDKSSIRTLAYLAYRCRSRPLMIVMSVRPEGEKLHDTFRAVVDTRVLRVEPMTVGSATELLEAICAVRSLTLRPDARQALLLRAAGNPFFLTALAEDSLREVEGHATIPSMPVPESIATLILSRTRQVSLAAQDTLRCLALVRTEEPIDVIARIVRRSPVRVARALEELVTMRLVTDGLGGSSIAHDIIADVVHRSITGTVRRYLHSNAAKVMAHRGPAVVANHASEARDWDVAFPAAMEAAGNAARLGGYSEAEFFYAVAKTAARSDDQKSAVGAAYLSFACGLDRFSSAANLVPGARRHFARTRDEIGLLRCRAVELDSAVQEGRGPLSTLTSEALRMMHRAQDLGSTSLAAEIVSVLYRAVEVGGVEVLPADWLAEAIAVAESAEVNWKVTLLGKAAVLSYFTQGVRKAQELAARLPSLAGDDVRLRALADVYVGVTLMFLGRLGEAEDFFLEALQLAKDPALSDAYQKASMNLAVLETDIGKYESARHRLTEFAHGSRPTAVSIANFGFLCLEIGDIDAAEAAAENLRRRTGSLEAPLLGAAALTLEGSAAWIRGDYSRARRAAEVLEGLLDCIPFQSDDSYARVLVARVKGLMDPREALAVLTQPARRPAVPQLRVDLECAQQLARLDPDAAKQGLSSVIERAEAIGAAPIGMRAASFVFPGPLP